MELEIVGRLTEEPKPRPAALIVKNSTVRTDRFF